MGNLTKFKRTPTQRFLLVHFPPFSFLRVLVVILRQILSAPGRVPTSQVPRPAHISSRSHLLPADMLRRRQRLARTL